MIGRREEMCWTGSGNGYCEEEAKKVECKIGGNEW